MLTLAEIADALDMNLTALAWQVDKCPRKSLYGMLVNLDRDARAALAH